MSLLSYQGHFQDGHVVLPNNFKIPANGEFVITFNGEEKTDEEIVKEQGEAFERFIKNIDAIDDEPLGEEFDKAMKNRLNFR